MKTNEPAYQTIPCLTTAQMAEVDRVMLEDYHIELIQMMENAGRSLAHLARRRFLDRIMSTSPVSSGELLAVRHNDQVVGHSITYS